MTKPPATTGGFVTQKFSTEKAESFRENLANYLIQG
jgi:hypothetical protein